MKIYRKCFYRDYNVAREGHFDDNVYCDRTVADGLGLYLQ